MKRTELKTINDLKRFIKNFFNKKDVRIFFFGSRARGDHSPFSDIDIAIDSKEDISSDITKLREILENSNLPYKVDIVRLSTNEKLRQIVGKEGIRWL